MDEVEEEEREEKVEEEQKDGSDFSWPPSPDPAGVGSPCEEETGGAEVAEVVVQLDSLDLEGESELTSNISHDTQPTLSESDSAPQVPLLPPPPSCIRHKESSGSERNTDSDQRSTATLTPPQLSVSIPASSPTNQSPSIPSTPTSPSCASSPSPPSTSCLRPSPSANSLSTLPPPGSSTFYKTPSPTTPSLSSISSFSSSRPHMSSSPSTPAFPSTPKHPVFSPFPSVKQPRKSAAARNLGLYGPTARTPTVHFPQLSRNLNRSSGVGTTGRR